MGIVLALAAALVYGAADFFGGLASKRNVVWGVVFVSGVTGLVTAIVALPLLGLGPPQPRDLELGAIVGVVGLIGIAALYRGLAIARMSVVAPITAVVAASVPIFYGVVRGERPSLPAIIGIVLALGAVALVSRSSDEDVAGDPEPQRAGLLLALLSGLGFGLVYVLLAASSRGAWPLVASRTMFVIFTGLIVWRMRLPALTVRRHDALRRADRRARHGRQRALLAVAALHAGGDRRRDRLAVSREHGHARAHRLARALALGAMGRRGLRAGRRDIDGARLEQASARPNARSCLHAADTVR